MGAVDAGDTMVLFHSIVTPSGAYTDQGISMAIVHIGSATAPASDMRETFSLWFLRWWFLYLGPPSGRRGRARVWSAVCGSWLAYVLWQSRD